MRYGGVMPLTGAATMTFMNVSTPPPPRSGARFRIVDRLIFPAVNVARSPNRWLTVTETPASWPPNAGNRIAVLTGNRIGFRMRTVSP